eukprot:SAG31_NODE_2920_length_4909_cov_14.892100_2_plen_94_part_00
MNALYECPDEDYQWASSRDVLPLMTGEREPPSPYYLDLGGWEGITWEGNYSCPVALSVPRSTRRKSVAVVLDAAWLLCCLQELTVSTSSSAIH